MDLSEVLPPDEDSGDDILEQIAADLIAAVESGDTVAVAAALRAAHEECAATYGAE